MAGPSSLHPSSLSKDPLKLKALDTDDLVSLSALLQDAIVPLGSMAHHPKERAFSLLAHRFRWEKDPLVHQDTSLYERIHSLLSIHHVLSVQTKGLKDTHNPNQILNVLCLTFQEGNLILTFSNDIHLQVNVEKLLVSLEDLDTSWPTPHKPHHSDV